MFPNAGTVIVNQFSSAKIRRKEIPFLRRRIGFIFQDFKLLRDRNVFENVAFALIVTGAKTSIIKKKVLRVLTEVGLSHKRNIYPKDLSGGEQQRVAIARALINEPFILLADEPTGNLNSEQGKEIMDLFKKLNQNGTTIVQVTHSEEKAAYGQKIINLLDGRIVSS